MDFASSLTDLYEINMNDELIRIDINLNVMNLNMNLCDTLAMNTLNKNFKQMYIYIYRDTTKME